MEISSQQFVDIGEPLEPLDLSEDRPFAFLDTRYPGVEIERKNGLVVTIKRATTFTFQFDDAFTKGRLLSPQIDDMGSGKILWNGVLTSRLFSKKDPVRSLLKLTKESRIVGESYPDVAVEAAFRLVGKSSSSHFSSITLRPVQKKQWDDEIVLHESTLDGIRKTIANSSVWFLNSDQLFFELENEDGVKLVTRLSSRSHVGDVDSVFVSSYVAENLLKRNQLLTLRLVRVPVAKSLSIWIQDSTFRTDEVKERILNDLSELTVFTAGTLMKSKDDVIYSVVEATSWNHFPFLNVNAVTTLVPSSAHVEMRVSYV